MRTSTALMAAAALLLLLVSLAAADMSIISYRERSEEETRRMFVEWMATHGKTYNTIGEEERRYALFKAVLRFIDQHNAAAGVHSYRLGLNHFADLTDEEFRARCCGRVVRNKPERERKLSARYQAADNEDLPDSVDWRKKGAVAEVKRFSS